MAQQTVFFRQQGRVDETTGMRPAPNFMRFHHDDKKLAKLEPGRIHAVEGGAEGNRQTDSKEGGDAAAIQNSSGKGNRLPQCYASEGRIAVEGDEGG